MALLTGQVKHLVKREDVEDGMAKATESMQRLNRVGAELMHKYGAHAATDVTGFGILGHARNLAENQTAPCNFVIDTLPCLEHMLEVDAVESIFKLRDGFSAETSGTPPVLVHLKSR